MLNLVWIIISMAVKLKLNFRVIRLDIKLFQWILMILVVILVNGPMAVRSIMANWLGYIKRN